MAKRGGSDNVLALPQAGAPARNTLVTPVAIEAEKSTLGAMMMERDAIKTARRILVADDFYREHHRQVYKAILAVYDRDEPVDLITVVEELRNHNQLQEDGVAYLTALIGECPAAAAVDTYASIVLDKSNKRSSLSMAEKLTAMGSNGAGTMEIVRFMESHTKALALRAPGANRGPRTYTGIELLKKQIPEPRWAVLGLIPVGVTIVAGPPKLGKSWMVLSMVIAIASGGYVLAKIPVEKGAGLYLALEDTELRMQDRCIKVLADLPMPEGFEYAIEWPRLGSGCAEYLVAWLEKHPDARIIVIDTFKKVRPVRSRQGDIYGEDYSDVGDLKSVADQYGIAIVLVHHVNKVEHEDPMNSVSGTFGVTGAADAVLVLNRRRGQSDATLHTSGRDISEQAIALHWDSELGTWAMMGDAEEYKHAQRRREIMEVVEKEGTVGISPVEVAELLEAPHGSIKVLMMKMEREGALERISRGRYRICVNLRTLLRTDERTADAEGENPLPSNENDDNSLPYEGTVRNGVRRLTQISEMPEREVAVREVMLSSLGPASPKEIGEELDITPDNARAVLHRMMHKGTVEKGGHGTYWLTTAGISDDLAGVIANEIGLDLVSIAPSERRKAREFIAFWDAKYDARLTREDFDTYFPKWQAGEMGDDRTA